MLRATWDKTTNPYVRTVQAFLRDAANCFVMVQIRFFTHLDRVSLHRKVLLARPSSSPYTRPITVHLFYSPKDQEGRKDPVRALAKEEDLVLDFPGGGFVAMSPEHHEERLRRWAVKIGKPIASIEYGKAPECMFVFMSRPSFPS